MFRKLGEKSFINKSSEKFLEYWHHRPAGRRAFIDTISNKNSLSNRNFLFDGSNFRGYLTDMELVAKAYMNDWAVAVTTKVMAEENDTYLLNISDIIKTETYDENMKLYLNEGIEWAKNKYGFQSKWDFVRYAKLYYDDFFRMNPELLRFKI